MRSGLQLIRWSSSDGYSQVLLARNRGSERRLDFLNRVKPARDAHWFLNPHQFLKIKLRPKFMFKFMGIFREGGANFGDTNE